MEAWTVQHYTHQKQAYFGVYPSSERDTLVSFDWGAASVK